MLRRLVLLPLLCLALAGCPDKTAPATDAAAPEVAAAPAPAPVDTAAPPPAQEPVPVPEQRGKPRTDHRGDVALPGAKPPGQVDRSCKVDADCAVKDVGNCCGYYPACVNKDSPTFPDQVQAACAAEGRSSICGFQEISGCGCVEGQCVARSAGLVEPGRTD